MAALLLLLFLKPLFAVSLSDLKSLSATTQSKLQYNLRAMLYDIGPVDGKIGKKSFSAVKLFLNRNGQDLSSMSVDDLLKIIEQHAIKTLKKQKRKLPETFNFKLISKNHLN